MQTLEQAATYYASMGWPVFPLKPKSKAPATEHGFLDATTDTDQIGAWWGRNPNYNVGLATGILFDVIDFDSIDALEAFVAEDERGEVDGPIVMTHRGAHCYVKPSGWGTLKPRPGIDYKAIGGYVVAPPSIHPDGGQYSWLDGYDAERPMTSSPGWLTPMPIQRESKRFEGSASGDRPGDLYNASGTFPDLLLKHGWTYAGKHAGRERWCRPGKTPRQGISATLSEKSFYVFSSSSECGPLAADGAHSSFSPFYAYALLEHDGDMSAAAMALRDPDAPTRLMIGGT